METNQITGDCNINVDGETIILNFRTSAMILLEAKTGVGCAEFLERQDHVDTRRLEDIRTLFDVQLEKHHSDMGDQQRADLIDKIPVDRLFDIVSATITAASTVEKEGDENPTGRKVSPKAAEKKLTGINCK